MQDEQGSVYQQSQETTVFGRRGHGQKYPLMLRSKVRQRQKMFSGWPAHDLACFYGTVHHFLIDF